MKHQIKTLLVEPDQRSEIVFALAHHRSGALRALVADDKQVSFFQDFMLNLNFTNLKFSTFGEYFTANDVTQQSIILIDVPINFEETTRILQKAKLSKQIVYLVLLKANRKYLQMLPKHLPVSFEIMEFSANKFIGINDRLRQFVDKSYDLNRAAFYAYGSYINYFRSNLLKRIFKTDQIDVAKLARSFGFTTPPRVKEGKFLSLKAQHEKKKQTSKSKKSQKKTESAKEGGQSNAVAQASTSVAKTKKIKKVSK